MPRRTYLFPTTCHESDDVKTDIEHILFAMFVLVFVLKASCFYWRFCCSSMHSTRGNAWNNACGRRERDLHQSVEIMDENERNMLQLFPKLFCVMALSAPTHPFKTRQAVCALGAAAALPTAIIQQEKYTS
jgi:hypothetical protein